MHTHDTHTHHPVIPKHKPRARKLAGSSLRSQPHPTTMYTWHTYPPSSDPYTQAQIKEAGQLFFTSCKAVDDRWSRQGGVLPMFVCIRVKHMTTNNINDYRWSRGVCVYVCFLFWSCMSVCTRWLLQSRKGRAIKCVNRQAHSKMWPLVYCKVWSQLLKQHNLHTCMRTHKQKNPHPRIYIQTGHHTHTKTHRRISAKLSPASRQCMNKGLRSSTANFTCIVTGYLHSMIPWFHNSMTPVWVLPNVSKVVANLLSSSWAAAWTHTHTNTHKDQRQQ